MGEDFRSAPVPISLSIRHSSGRVATYGARALAYDDSSLQVLSSEEFEKGTLITVRAPFLENAVACLVSASARSRTQPEYFDVALKFVRKPAADSQARKPAAQPAILQSAARAAREMAARLERSESRRFSQVLAEIHPTRRPLFCSLTAVALMSLLEQKTGLDAGRIFEAISRSGQQAPDTER